MRKAREKGQLLDAKKTILFVKRWVTAAAEDGCSYQPTIAAGSFDNSQGSISSNTKRNGRKRWKRRRQQIETVVIPNIAGTESRATTTHAYTHTHTHTHIDTENTKKKK